MRKQLLILLSLFFISSQFMYSQGSPDYNGGFKVKFNEDGSKYLRIISWAQMQGIYNTDVPEDVNHFNFKLKRARILLFSQITPKFLILMHIGLNNFTASTMSPVGKGEGSQIFLHDAWVQYQVAKNHTVGGGLHYFNGISRLNNQSTLNILTLDNNRQSWATLGLTDQFARHLGIFAKGKFGKLQYRVAINDVMKNGLDMREPALGGNAVYGGKRILGSDDAGFAYAGYFDYNFLDQESNFLPFKVGSYLGGKKVFNVGAGFFFHPNGSVVMDDYDLFEGENVSIFAIDAFYDSPVGGKGAAITAYMTFQSNNYGRDYLYSAYGTGSMFYTHFAYLFGGDKTKVRFQPYVSFAANSYDAISDNRNIFGIGANMYMSGHNSKLTLEYKHQSFVNSTGQITLQAMIYL